MLGRYYLEQGRVWDQEQEKHEVINWYTNIHFKQLHMNIKTNNHLQEVSRENK